MFSIHVTDVHLSEDVLRTDPHSFTRRGAPKDHHRGASLGPGEGLFQGGGEPATLDDDVESKLLAVDLVHGGGQGLGVGNHEASVCSE